jgi:hypothetical protein
MPDDGIVPTYDTTLFWIGTNRWPSGTDINAGLPRPNHVVFTGDHLVITTLEEIPNETKEVLPQETRYFIVYPDVRTTSYVFLYSTERARIVCLPTCHGASAVLREIGRPVGYGSVEPTFTKYGKCYVGGSNQALTSSLRNTMVYPNHVLNKTNRFVVEYKREAGMRDEIQETLFNYLRLNGVDVVYRV